MISLELHFGPNETTELPDLVLVLRGKMFRDHKLNLWTEQNTRALKAVNIVDMKMPLHQNCPARTNVLQKISLRRGRSEHHSVSACTPFKRSAKNNVFTKIVCPFLSLGHFSLTPQTRLPTHTPNPITHPPTHPTQPTHQPTTCLPPSTHTCLPMVITLFCSHPTQPLQSKQRS